MEANKKKLKSELHKLIRIGRFIFYDIAIENNNLSDDQIEILKKSDDYNDYKKQAISTKSSYQSWFTSAYNVIKQILPDRKEEFYSLYKNEKRKEIDYLTYTISDYILGLIITRGWEKTEVVNPYRAFAAKMQIQIDILESCYKSIDSKLSDIKGILQYELFENELQAAKDLLTKKYNRAAGALAGVTLEIHLSQVCDNHNIRFKKKNPTITDFNEELKKLDIIDIPTWRLIQRLGDIRNMSVHSKDREPSKDEVEDLIKGIEKLIAELY